jgi:hypothetical protein
MSRILQIFLLALPLMTACRSTKHVEMRRELSAVDTTAVTVAAAAEVVKRDSLRVDDDVVVVVERFDSVGRVTERKVALHGRRATAVATEQTEGKATMVEQKNEHIALVEEKKEEITAPSGKGLLLLALVNIIVFLAIFLLIRNKS